MYYKIIDPNTVPADVKAHFVDGSPNILSFGLDKMIMVKAPELGDLTEFHHVPWDDPRINFADTDLPEISKKLKEDGTMQDMFVYSGINPSRIAYLKVTKIHPFTKIWKKAYIGRSPVPFSLGKKRRSNRTNSRKKRHSKKH
jgi:hypothetical protein